MPECEFCAIAAGERDVHVLYEDAHTVAFLDENPAREGHTVVLPKQHREELLGTADGGAAAVFAAIDAIVADLRAVLDPEGFSLFYTSGPLVGSVRHAHVHLVPRATDDGVSLALDRGPIDDDTAAALAERVRNLE
ncbi:HIT family protein [Halolamina salifodinae]|uniref:Histidine triad (HIT) family protein n=1 Tax=Halolamina salifodinae TaxID=1202767 RepID=A0A8T4GUY1_9EURY|nr:HIT family protein [Halolamina salifodinae]MBP1986931.1 histidine triad (HIT) family protein [Halolamina salifodinae]